MRRDILSSPRLTELKKRRRRAILNKFLILLLGLLVVFGLLAYLSRLNNLNIAEIQISGNKVVETEMIKTTVEQEITGKYLWLFPKTNILYYPQNTIRNVLQGEFKRLKDINFSIENNKILKVSLTERVAKYTWCGNTLLINNQKCYFLDEDGYIFDEAPYFSGEVYFKFYGSTDILPEILGSAFAKGNFKQLISFKDVLIDLNLKPVMLSIAENGVIEIFLSKNASIAIGPKIILKIDSDFQNVAENLKAALNTEPLLSKFKNKYSSLLYIDLRFGNKVYYKFQ